MSKAKRYKIVDVHNDEESWSELKESENGQFVEYKDYAELEQEKVELIEAYKYVIKNGIFELAQVRNEICNVLNKYRI